MKTRAKNADTHPGQIVKDALRSQRPKEVIQKEKEGKQAKKDAADQVKAIAEAGVHAAEQIEAEDELATAKEGEQIPRRRQRRSAKANIQKPETKAQADANIETGKKRKASTRAHNAKQPKVIVQDEGDTDTAEDSRPHKKSKVGSGAQPLRRTETALEPFEVNEQGTALTEADVSRLFDDPLTSEADGQMDVEEEALQTPRPVHKQDGQNQDDADSDTENIPADNENVPFETPLARRSRNAQPAPPADIQELTDSEEEIVFKKVGKQQKKAVEKERAKEQTSSTAPRHAAHVNNDKANPKTLSSHIHTNLRNDHARSHSQSNSSTVRPPASRILASSRPVSSNKLVSGRVTALPKPKKVKTAKEPKEDPKPERAIGGMESEEDDTLEKQAALSSPMKGSEFRQVGKSLVKIKVEKEDLQALTKVKVEKEDLQALTKVKAEKGVKPQRRKVQVKDLPDGAQNFNREVIPVFICLIYAGDVPWPLDERDIAPHLQIAWDQRYRRKIPFDIERRSVPYELAIQKLSDLRNKFGTKAILSFYLFYRENVNPDADIEQDKDEMAEFAASLMPNKFIYKGMEDLENPRKTGTFRHKIFLETLSAFMGFLDIQVLTAMYHGREGGLPLCSLAIAASAVERAVKLFKEKMIEQKVDSRGIQRLVVRKVENPETKKSSGYSTDFSWELWNTAAQQYMESIKALGDKRIMEILQESFNLTDSLGRRNPFVQVDRETSNSARTALRSDDEDLETSEWQGVDDAQYQEDDDNTSTQHARTREGAAADDSDADNLDRRPLIPACGGTNDADDFFIRRRPHVEASESEDEDVDQRPRPRPRKLNSGQQK